MATGSDGASLIAPSAKHGDDLPCSPYSDRRSAFLSGDVLAYLRLERTILERNHGKKRRRSCRGHKLTTGGKQTSAGVSEGCMKIGVELGDASDGGHCARLSDMVGADGNAAEGKVVVNVYESVNAACTNEFDHNEAPRGP